MKTIIPIEIEPIKKDGFHCFVKLLINEKINVRMVIDTGASRTVFDYNFIEKANLKNKLYPMEEKASGLGTDSMEGHRVVIQSIKLRELICLDFEVGILDLSHINKGYESINLPLVDGALGGDLLYRYDGIIDYKNKTLSLNQS